VKGAGNLFGATPTYNIPQTSALRDAADKFGISLTPAEETGNRTLINRQRLLQNTPGADQTFSDFYNSRNDQVSSAVNGLLDNLDPARSSAISAGVNPPPPIPSFASPRAGMGQGVDAAGKIVQGIKQDMAARAKPFYDAALAPGNVIPARTIQNTLSPAEQSILQSSIDGARGDSVLGPQLQGWQDNSMYVLDQAKKNNDSAINAAQMAGDNNRARILTGLNQKLVGMMDDAQPYYKTARGIYTDGMPNYNAVTNGAVGDIAGLTGTDVNKAGQALFGKYSSPQDVRTAKAAFIKSGNTDQWDAMAGGYLRQVFNQIGDTTTSGIPNVGGMFNKAVMGNPTKRAMLQAAFDHQPDFMANMNALSSVLQATSAATRGDSITAFAQAGQKQLQREGGGIIPKLLDGVEIWNVPSNVASYMRDLNTGKFADRQAALFTTPAGRDTLKELRKLGPTSAGAVMALSNFLTAGVAGAAQQAVTPSLNGPVSSTLATPGYP